MSTLPKQGKTVMTIRMRLIHTKGLNRAAIPLFASIMGVMLLGCAQAQAPQTHAATPKLGEPQSLLIQGYNYTDDYIDSFTVNGQGGGNLFVSGPSSGGGGSVCCVSYRPGTPLPIKLKVRWVGGYCIERVNSPYPYGKPFYDNRRHLWKEAEAQAVDLSNGKPSALEVHIFPDDHVEAAITQGYSDPRLRLSRSDTFERPGSNNSYPNCTNDQLKQFGQ